ncbi:putative carbohydrate esterase [Quercus suber]|uniref:Carbohydrate esterase n=1 Tax=Quercus suber TaxID=58331 RepID=A0AAW0L6Z7_QUESU
MSKGMLLFFFFFVALAGSVCPEEVKPKNIFILAGQSNMAGRGGLNTPKWDGKIPHESNPNPNILQLALDNSWVQAHEPLHVGIDYGKTVGIGPGLPFANAILAKDPSFGVIGLVPCAKGATKIKQWALGTKLYKRLVAIASAEGPLMETVREAQLSINLNNVKCIDAKGSHLNKDNLHLDTASQVLLGQKLADTFLSSFSH